MTRMGWLEKIQASWACDLKRYVPFWLGEGPIGYVRGDAVAVVESSPFVRRARQGLALAGPVSVVETTTALADITERLHDSALIPSPTGEMYAVRYFSKGGDLGYVDRAATLALGILTLGVHLNAYVTEKSALSMWVARRSRSKRHFPGMLDNLVAGGQPAGIGLVENLEKEAEEEAAMTASLSSMATFERELAYRFDGPDGLVDSVAYAFDLEVPRAFQPRNTDGSIEAFYLLPIEDVARLLRDTDGFKFNCGLVVIDFLLRHRNRVSEPLDDLVAAAPLLYRSEPRAEMKAESP